MIRPLFLALSLLAAGAAQAEQLSVARVFAAPSLNGPAPKGVQISPDGGLLSYLKPQPADPNTFDLWVRPVAGGAERRLIDGGAVEPKGVELSEAEKIRRERQRIAGDHGVTAYSWELTGNRILVPAGGRLYLADARTGEVKQLGQTGGGATDAKLSPKGGYVAYVRDQNLRVVDLKTGADTALTTEGEASISFGMAEFVAQEEMDRYTGYWIAPDDSRVAFARVDEGPVEIVPRFDIGAEGVTLVNQRYPRTGRANAVVELYVAPIVGGARVKVDLGPNTDVYLARVAWSKDGRTLYVQRESRDQHRLDLLQVDPATGASKVILTETAAAWLNLNDDFTPLTGGDFIWGSERSGFHHLYLYDRGGKLIRQITRGDWPVAQNAGAGLQPSSVAGLDEKAGVLYFIASVDSPMVRNLYSVSYRKAGPPRKITGGDGWWGVDLSRDLKSFVGSYTDEKTPPQVALYGIDGRRLSWIEENVLGPGHPYFPYLDRKTYPEYGTLKAEDGQTLYYSVLKPDGFDPAKKYPAIISLYGGPGPLPYVTKRWASGADQLLTQAGFVVFKLDNRGTSNRGVKFEAPIYKAMGGVEVKDHLQGRRFLASLPYVDPKRIGVQGWSYGGYMTIRLLTEPGSGLVSGAAGGPPSDWRLYDTHYTERYMGNPNTDGAAYDASALLPRLPELAKPGAPRLLLLHGMADDNVVFENSTRIMAALQAQATPFDLMLFPGQGHGIQTPPRQIQLWETYLAFFKRTLGGPQ